MVVVWESNTRMRYHHRLSRLGRVAYGVVRPPIKLAVKELFFISDIQDIFLGVIGNYGINLFELLGVL